MSVIEGEYKNQGASRRRYYKCKVSTRDQEEGAGSGWNGGLGAIRAQSGT